MSTPTHILVGIVLAKASMDIGITPDYPHLIYPLAIIAANIPDIDAFIIRFPRDHRMSILHYPSLWAFLLLCSYLVLEITEQTSLLSYFALISTCLLSHFILDTFAMITGIHWFAPFSKRMIKFLPRPPILPTNIREFIIMYIKHPIMILEGSIWILGYLYLIGEL